jgi:simple sugar transport system permease protein
VVRQASKEICMIRKITKSHEFVVAAAIVVLSFLVGAINPAYFSLANFFDLLRNATIPGFLALGVLVVLISGGVDVSFPAIAAASSYIAVRISLDIHSLDSAWVIYLMALPIGILLGMINAAFISWFRLPTLIVTLGTSGMYYGFVLFFVGNLVLYNLPAGMVSYRMMSLMTADAPVSGSSSLHPSILFLAMAAMAVWILLRHTMIGRGIYAIGGNREAAERLGFNLHLIESVIYGLTGALASIAGVTQAVLYRNANPAALMGAELDVIAAVVLGGAAIDGGRGTVIGTLLGLFLVTILRSALVLVGIPAEWQRAVVGIALIIGTSLPVIRSAQVNRRMSHTLLE